MVTVIAGKSHGGQKAKIVSLSDAVGETNEFEFEANSRADIKPGVPKWANYVKGCIANFICKLFTLPESNNKESQLSVRLFQDTFCELRKDVFQAMFLHSTP